jgi:hypothetical protein
MEVDENLLRHMFLNSIRFNRKKFSGEYGEIVICADSTNVWRKDYYPYYKANRKKNRDQSDMDWNACFDAIHQIRRELEEFFPYKVVYVDRVEADDIIATLCMEHGTELNNGSEKILVLSGDKDFIQLQQYANVDQYNPVLKKWVRHANPTQYITEHILRGDTGDGVPNILSADNCLAVGDRQKPMTKKRIELFSAHPEEMDEETKLRYNRNKQMIDLTMIPQEYKDNILEAYNNQEEVGRGHLFNYFVKKKLKNLIGDLQDF